MTSFAHSKLTALQGEVLDAFFQRERGFFLTGGAALAGFQVTPGYGREQKSCQRV